MIGRIVINYENQTVQIWGMDISCKVVAYSPQLENELSIMAYGWWHDQHYNENDELVRVIYTRGLE